MRTGRRNTFRYSALRTHPGYGAKSIEPTDASQGQRRLGILHGPDLCLGILHTLCSGILYGLYGLYGPDLCPRLLLGRPSLELLQQGFGRWLTDFGRALIRRLESGRNFVARRRVPCGRRQSLGAGR
jgi:hypothetical protein